MCISGLIRFGMHPIRHMGLLKNVWAGRPFWSKKLGQLVRLVYESHARPITGAPGKPQAIPRGALGIMFLGHSSFLLQMAGLNLLVDPVFATRLIVLRRQRRPGVRIADLPAIDAVLLTHAHMDHLNRPTLRAIVRATRKLTGRAPIAIIPQGVEDLVADLGFSEIRTLDWWQRTTLPGVEITFTPAQHWGARMFKDTHRRFGGYVLADSAGHSLYHSGDTALFPGFTEIGRRLHPQIALLPIGAYFPDSYRGVHTSPEDALDAFQQLGSRTFIPMHFGTFRLGREPMEEPPLRLMAEAERRGLTGQIRILAEGETLIVPPQP